MAWSNAGLWVKLWPAHERRQAHENGLHIAARLGAELGAPVVQQVELRITAAANELLLALRPGPGLPHPSTNDLGIDVEKCQPHIAGEGEIRLPIAGIEVVEEDSARAARLAPVRQEEVLVAPLPEARIVAGVVGVAGAAEGGVEIARVLLVR